jgi:hypothetical protein
MGARPVVRTMLPRDAALAAPEGQEVLYNGITLPSPGRRSAANSSGAGIPALPPASPAVIPIDVGRQLFVDDFLLEECELIARITRHPTSRAI